MPAGVIRSTGMNRLASFALLAAVPASAQHMFHGNPAHTGVYATPGPQKLGVVNGKVYFGSGDGNVYALDAQTGVLLWKFATKDVVHSSPAVVDRTVYIGSWDSHLYAIDTETGQQRWTFKSGDDDVIHNQVGFQSSPAVVDG